MPIGKRQLKRTIRPGRVKKTNRIDFDTVSYYLLSRTMYMVRLFHLMHTRQLAHVSKYISVLLTLSLVVDIIMVKIKIGGLS